MASYVPKLSYGRVASRFGAYLSACAMVVMFAGCEAPGESAPGSPGSPDIERPVDSLSGYSPETDRPGSIAARYLAQARFAEADFERGELLSFACIVCHTLGPGEEHLAGPNLNGIFGRPAANAPEFPYSDALTEAGIIWTPAELDGWLARPDDFVPGNLMVFAGIYSDSDRTDLLAYLLRETAAEEPAPTQ